MTDYQAARKRVEALVADWQRHVDVPGEPGGYGGLEKDIAALRLILSAPPVTVEEVAWAIEDEDVTAPTERSLEGAKRVLALFTKEPSA